jgi:hypothetical protein
MIGKRSIAWRIVRHALTTCAYCGAVVFMTWRSRHSPTSLALIAIIFVLCVYIQVQCALSTGRPENRTSLHDQLEDLDSWDRTMALMWLILCVAAVCTALEIALRRPS